MKYTIDTNGGLYKHGELIGQYRSASQAKAALIAILKCEEGKGEQKEAEPVKVSASRFFDW